MSLALRRKTSSRVITSYSIHYTKLYDDGAEHAAEVQRVLENALAAARGEGSLEDAAAGKGW